MRGPGLLQLRSHGCRQVWRPQSAIRSFIACQPRLASSASIAKPSTAKLDKALLPEKLVVYHAGTGRTMFLACLKVTTVFTLAFYGFVVTPASISGGEPWWKVAGVALCGIIPFCFIAYVTSPFVTTIHLHLPAFARQSKEIMTRFIKNPPDNARIDFTTISLIGKPRMSPMTVSDLRPTHQRFGLVNYVRDTKPINAGRPWYMYPAVAKFFVQQGPANPRRPTTWEDLAASIARRSQR